MSRRTERVNRLLREEISDSLQHQLKDPRLDSFITITRVSTTPDLRYAKVFVSIMGSKEEKASALAALSTASGFLHRQLKARLTLRRIPELSFHQDDSIEHGARILELIKQVTESE
jgi:ribosome-binding factor A